jgi:polyisoprenyl-teichoic acid--peptidoglycan teichoic acid transferase
VVRPVPLALRFSQIAATLKENPQTSIPLRDIDAWVTLALRVKKSHVRSLALTDQVINTAHPDFERLHQLVQDALTPPAAAPGAVPTPSCSASPSGSQHKARTATVALDVNRVC